MKGNISRDNHRPDNRYSGVFQVQGGMVTDADLGEQAAISRDRVDALGHDTVCCGTPAEGGAVVISDNRPSLVEGVVYAEGVRGQTAASEAFEGPMGYYSVQTDFPMAPPIREDDTRIVYVDIWERMVSHLEDTGLSDDGLHGVETAYRSRTMTQIKIAPAELIEDLETGTGRFPRIGTGTLSVEVADPETIQDICDPCADTVTADQTVANALFRIEVIAVEGEANDPRRITIAWSAENGSATAPSTVNPEDFERAGAVYEFFSPVTESHKGVIWTSDDVQVSSFATQIAEGPETPIAPEGGPWPFVRRWDGAAQVEFGEDDVAQIGGGNQVSVDDSVVQITVDAFTATLNFRDRAVLAGDYWLVEMRRFSDTPIRVVQETPIGILHNYCALFLTALDTPLELSDERRRRLSFPCLSNLPASHIALDNNCEKLFEDAENVQEALDNLCNINAADIPFDPSDCTRLFDNTDNVQDALINLCRVDFGNERLLRLLHDWGVVCGVIPRLVQRNTDGVRISSGTILNRAGVLGQVEAMDVRISDLIGTSAFHFPNLDTFDSDLAQTGVCLALEIAEGGEIRPHVLPKSQAFEPRDPTFQTVLAECLEQRPFFDPQDDFTTRPDREQAAFDKVFYGAAKPELAGAQGLDAFEFQTVRAYNDDYIVRYEAHINDPVEQQELRDQIARATEGIDIEGARGSARETRQLQFEAARYRATQEHNRDRTLRCLCDALLPRCPVVGDPPHLVPIACLEGRISGPNEVALSKVCAYDCRKQSINWRMIQYYIYELRTTWAGRLAETCCPDPQPPGGVVRPGLDFTGTLQVSPDLREQFVVDRFDESFSILVGERSAADFRTVPDVANLGIDQAEGVLVGNGVEIAETIDVGDSDAISRLRGSTVGIDTTKLVFDDGKLKPGDKVALITQNGVAIDYVRVEDGPGKLIFDRAQAAEAVPAPDGLTASRPTETTAATGLDAATLAEADNATRALEERLARIQEEARTAENDLLSVTRQRTQIQQEVAASAQALTDLENRRIALDQQITANQATIAALSQERQELASAVELSNTRLVELREERTALEAEVTASRTDLRRLAREQERTIEATRAERDELVMSVRRNMPVTQVVRENDQLTAALAERNVTTMGGLAELPDNELRVIARESGTNVRTLTSLRTTAGRQINADIE